MTILPPYNALYSLFPGQTLYKSCTAYSLSETSETAFATS
jgi:hypothetical protein